MCSQAPKNVQPSIAALSECSDAALLQCLRDFALPPKIKADLWVWAAVLNRFDTILEHACKAFEAETFIDPYAAATTSTTTAASSSSSSSSSASTTAPSADLIKEVLRVTLAILESSTNRVIYCSVEVRIDRSRSLSLSFSLSLSLSRYYQQQTWLI